MDGGNGITSKLTTLHYICVCMYMLHLTVFVTRVHTHRKVTTFGWSPIFVIYTINSGFSLTASQLQL